MDSNQKFLALVIPKAWKYTMPVEAHDKLGYQGATQMYCLIKCHELGYQEIHISMPTLPQRKSKGSSLPSTDD